MKLTYADKSHAYYLDGKRATSVTSVAKIPVDKWGLEAWDRRMVATGMAIDPNLVENVAAHIDDKDRLDEICEEAKRIAKSHLKADRGTQKHRVLELVALDQEDKLITDQQRADAVILKRTMDRYRLTPYDCMTEQFVAWPHYCVTGRFDAIMERPDGALWLIDLKSSENAILYPLQTEIQLALYGRAPFISANIDYIMGKAVVTDWRQMPERLEQRFAYVLLVDNDSEVGTLHEMDIEHGWAGAQIALNALEWRKKFNRGKDTVREVPEWGEAPQAVDWESLAREAVTVEELRVIWKQAAAAEQLTPELKNVLQWLNDVGPGIRDEGDPRYQANEQGVPLSALLGSRWEAE